MKIITKQQTMYGLEFISIVREIFTKHGFFVFELTIEGTPVDFIMANDKDTFIVEVRASRYGQFSADSILSNVNYILKLTLSEYSGHIPVLVISGVVDQELRNRISKIEYADKLVIIDIQNLLFLAGSDATLREKLVSALPYSIEHIQPLPPRGFCQSSMLNNETEDDLARTIESWCATDHTGSEYEELCINVLKRLFADDLALWSVQQKSDAGLFRFDLICKVKNGNTKEFWDMAERYFGSKYIVFEFKNYRSVVTQKEIFTTVKYLYKKALRSVAILVSVNGTDDHANMAIRGVLREEGKLILSLTNADLLKMLEMQQQKLEPTDYLSDKLDQMLIDLEK